VACTAMVHCERTADWFEDGTRALQTRGAKACGAQDFMLCANRTPPPTRDRCEDGMTCARTS
jgi:hypothetical protein